MSTNLKALIEKLNDTTRRALEAAAGLCVARTHYDIEIEHYLLKALDGTDNDVAAILKHFGIDRSRLTKELERSLDNLKSGNARSPAFSPAVVKMLSEAWTVASIDFNAGNIRTGFTLLALLGHDELGRMVKDISRELQVIPVDGLRSSFYEIVATSKEAHTRLAEGGTATEEGDAGEDAAPSKSKGTTPHLDQYTVNLTANAKAGKIDPVLGRDQEVRQMIDILMRRRQNNPILTGEAGVGKTAVVEGFANRVVSGDVPPALQGIHIHSLDLALLQAGAGVKGEFENRLKGLIKEVKSSTEKIILFIDEAHTMIGAGGQAGQGDAANLLKPALARGELRTIAATTWSEYKKYFEKDPALAIRFQVVKVEEPTESQCMTMLRGIVPSLENHHKVRILDEGLTAAVRLSHRYLAGRQLPDKAVSILDTACARLALGQSATPPAIEDAVRHLDDLEVQRVILERESAIGADHAERLTAIAKDKVEVESRLKALRERWTKEFELVSKIRDLHLQIEGAAAVAAPVPVPVAAGESAAASAPATSPPFRPPSAGDSPRLP